MAQNLGKGRLFAFSTAFALFSFGLFSTSQAALVDGFEAGWTLDEASGSFADASGNGNTLMPNDDPFGDGTNGIVGGALSLDGANDSTQNADVGLYGPTDTFSAAGWVNLDDLGGFYVFAGRRIQNVGGSDSGWALRNGGGGSRGTLRFTVESNDGQGGTETGLAETVAAVLSPGAWIHIAVVHNGSTDLSDTVLYVNGVAESNTTTGSSSLANGRASDADFSIGQRLQTASGNVDGRIDEFGLWSRALTSDEIGQLYNGGEGISLSTIVPEPASSAMLAGVGALMMLPRRRRGRVVSRHGATRA